MIRDLISIIVPVYGVEKYLRRCLDSLICQTYTNIEIIVVDDESPDSSGEICDEYAERDNRIHVIHQKNMGISGARNSGLDIARGEFIAFVDSDDFVSPHMYEYLLKALKQTNAEISICNFQKFKEGTEPQVSDTKFENTELNVITSKKEKIQYQFLQKNVDSNLVWNKLYKREIWEKFRFPMIRAYEDEAIIYQIIYELNKIVYLDINLYYYLLRQNGSITSSGFSEQRFLRLNVLQERMKFYIQKEEWEYFLESFFVYKTDLLKVTELIQQSKKYNMKLLSDYKKLYNEYCFKYLKCCKTSIKNKMTYLWYCIFPNWYFEHLKHK